MGSQKSPFLIFESADSVERFRSSSIALPQSIMAEDEHGNLEPPPRRSIDDPGAHDLGKDLQYLRTRMVTFDVDLIISRIIGL